MGLFQICYKPVSLNRIHFIAIYSRTVIREFTSIEHDWIHNSVIELRYG